MERTHTFRRAHGSIEASYVYDDQTGRLVRLIIRNDHPTLTVEMGVEEWTHEAGPDTGTTTLDLPASRSYPLVPDGGERGRPDDYPTIDVKYWARLT